jgi:hypothetical protein
MPRKSPENEDDFIRMQQEAIRRVRDMQERSRNTLESANISLDDREPARPAAAVNNPPRSTSHPGDGRGSRPLTQSVWTAAAPRSVTPPAGTHHTEQPPAVTPPVGRQTSGTAARGTQHAEPPPPDRQRAETPHSEVQRSGGFPFGLLGSVPPTLEPPHAPPEPERERSLFPPLLSNLLPSININFDSEQIMLMILIYVLYHDNADKFLILALAYILLI